MKWTTVEKNHCMISEMGHRAVKESYFPSGFEWHLFMPDRPSHQLKNPDAVFQTLKELKSHLENCKDAQNEA